MNPPAHVKKIATTFFYFAALALPLMLRAQTDTFSDGDDTFDPAWTRVEPLGAFGAGGTFTFPGGNTYRIQAPASPDPGNLGPARVGSTLPPVYTDFYASVDLVDWDDTLDQAVGLLARLDNVGLGTSTGYSFTYQELDHSISISRITSEAASDLSGSSIDLTLDRANDYRLVFIGTGDHFEGRVYQLPNIDTPIAVTRGTDATYASGISGLIVFDNSSGGAATADATFDNVVFSGVPQLVCGNNPPTVADDFNDQDDVGWMRYPNPTTLGQTWSFPTNPATAGNYAYRLTSSFGTTVANYGRNLSVRTNDVSYTDFCVQADLINWDNTQSQQMGVAARFQPGSEANAVPSCYMLIYANRFSSGSGGTDQLRIYEVSPTVGLGFLHQGQGNLGQFNVVPGGDPAPNPSGNYRLVFKGVGNVLTGQIIDLSTGIPMTFNADNANNKLTNMVATSWGTNFITGKVGIGVFQNNAGNPDCTLDNFVAHSAAPSASISQASGNVTVSWPTQDGIWVLESASDISGPWTEVTGSGSVTYANAQNTHTEPISAGNGFFRLRKI